MTAGAQTVHSERLSYGGPGMLWGCPAETVDSSFRPTATAGKFDQGTTGSTIPGDTAWLPLGDLGSATAIDYTITVEEIEVENSYEVVANIITKRMLSIKADLADQNMTNLSFVMNASASSWNGTPGATGVAEFEPGDIGSEARAQILWQSQSLNDAVLAFQVLQVGSISEKRGKGKAGMSTWATEFKGELPPSTIATKMYKRWFTGTAKAATLYTDI